jgi:hypothetical protein
MYIKDLSDLQLNQLIDNRWKQSESIWDTVIKMYEENLKAYKNNPGWLTTVPVKHSRVRANRIFVNVEAVINSLIGNQPQVNITPNRETPTAKELALLQEKFFRHKFDALNVKESMRMGLRNLYFSRLIVMKPYWDNKLNDFNLKAVDPRNIRVSKSAKNESESEFVIEEISDTLENVSKKFPEKAKDLMKEFGYKDEQEMYIANPTIKYKEAWIRDYVCFKYNNIILGKMRNPYWDWDGILITEEESKLLGTVEGDARREQMTMIKGEQGARKELASQALELEVPIPFESYKFNHFDTPRKPYIFATIFNNENSPIGQTDMIQQAIPLQEGVDRRKRQFDNNAELMNGIIKVDSNTMSKSDAQKLLYEAKGIIWGKGVVQGVARETGVALPSFLYEDMIDSRSEIDNLMAASSAFRGEREGTETKAGRLAMIEQSMLRLNELTQVVDYVSNEVFNWFYQLAKVGYTEHHYAKTLGKDNAIKILSIIQDDFMDGTEVTVIAGKTLPEDRVFKYQQAQNDVAAGFISPPDYLEIAGYDNPKELSKNAVAYKLDPVSAVGLNVAPVDVGLTPPGGAPPVPPGEVPQPGAVPSPLQPNALPQ